MTCDTAPEYITPETLPNQALHPSVPRPPLGLGCVGLRAPARGKLEGHVGGHLGIGQH